MSDLPETFVANLDQEIVSLTLATLDRLFDIDPDAALLYLFYCKTAKLQSQKIGYTNKVKASSTYCRKGLKWGSSKYETKKRLLIEHGFIENIHRKIASGTVVGWYVQINYLIKLDQSISNRITPQIQSISKPEGGFRATNAEYSISRNAVKYIYPSTIPSYSKKAVEHNLSSPAYSTSSHSSRDSLVPCTPEEIWEIAEKKNVSPQDVAQVHRQVLGMIEDGNKYKVKTVYRTLAKWVDLGISRGNIDVLTEEGRAVVALMNPKRDRELYEKLKKYE